MQSTIHFPHHRAIPYDFIFFPYEINGQLVFDDEKNGVNAEAFVEGADTFIKRVFEQDNTYLRIPENERFALSFGRRSTPPSHMICYRKNDRGGVIYDSPEFNASMWLCPNFFLYYKKAPSELFIEVMSVERACGMAERIAARTASTLASASFH